MIEILSSPQMMFVVAGIFVIAGMVKGVVGLGLPTVSLALLTVALGLKEAMALMLIPSLVTNIWQGLAGGALAEILRRLWSLFLFGCLAIWIGTGLLATADTGALSALLGLLLCVYSAISLATPQVPTPGRWEPVLTPATGAATGLLCGLTGSFVVPGVLYLQAVGAAARRTGAGHGRRLHHLDGGARGGAGRPWPPAGRTRRGLGRGAGPGRRRNGARPVDPAPHPRTAIPQGLLLRPACARRLSRTEGVCLELFQQK